MRGGTRCQKAACSRLQGFRQAGGPCSSLAQELRHLQQRQQGSLKPFCNCVKLRTWAAMSLGPA